MSVGLIGMRIGYTPVTGGGAYDNLNTWPSAANRPIYTIGTNTLDWVGPVGGGESTSSDVAQSQVLSASGAITTSSNGQVIENLAIDGGVSEQAITVNHDNVTIRRCYVKGLGGTSNGSYNIAISEGVIGTVIEDCEVDGNGGGSGSFNIIGYFTSLNSFTVRRCNLHNAEQMVARTMTNGVIIDNWMHDVTGDDADMIEIYVDSGASHNILIQHNTFENGSGGGAFNSAINMTNWNGATDLGQSISNINITGNRFMVPDFPHVFCDDNRQGSGTITYSATNNGFIDTITHVQTGDNDGVSPNSGNFVLTSSSDTEITGTAYGGTGAI